MHLTAASDEVKTGRTSGEIDESTHAVGDFNIPLSISN